MTTSQNDPFFQGGEYGGKTTMEADGLFVTFHMPEALRSRQGVDGEVAQALPPYKPRSAFQVDDYPAAPEQWLRSSAGVSSYMVAVKPEHGCWLDFNANARHTHDVAIMVSTQGVNAITAQKADKMRLEQYKGNCPVHNVPFGARRRCEQCNFEWPHQNYLSSTGQPSGQLWLDGFRAADGTVRQWVFTEDESRSVARAILGAERVHALGVAFFLSKEPKPKPAYEPRRAYLSMGSYGSEGTLGGGFATRGLTRGGPSPMIGSALPSRSRTFEVAAGAKIDQKIHQDPKSLDYWQETPAGIIVINYTDVATLAAVVRAGARQRSTEGPLGNLGIPLGHNPKS